MLLPQISSHEGFDFLVFDLLCGSRFKSGSIVGQGSSNNLGALGKDDDGALEVSNVLTLLLDENWVSLDQLVVNTFANSDLSASLVFEGSQGEWECREAFADF